MTDTCKEHVYFLETRSPGLVGRVVNITDDRVFYKIYKRNGKMVVLVGEDSNAKGKFFEQIEDGRLAWTKRPLGG